MRKRIVVDRGEIKKISKDFKVTSKAVWEALVYRSNSSKAILGVITFQMPAILLSGFISPVEDMPVFLQYFTYINPIRFFMVLTRGIFLKGMGLGDILMNLIPLIIIAFFTLSLASWTFKRKLD